MSAIPAPIREAVKERDQGRCFRCGMPAHDLHHRQRRRDGGHSLPNIIMLCGRGNTSGCHGWAHQNPREARDEGFIVSAYSNPETQWVWRWDGARVLLHDDGTVSFVEVGSVSD